MAHPKQSTLDRLRVKQLPQITNPSDALELFQEAFSKGNIPLMICKFDPSMSMCVDEPNGKRRISFVKVEGQTLTILVMFVVVGLRDGTLCFNIGYAVPPSHQGQGIAKMAVENAIIEMKNGIGRPFYVEAIVGLDNPTSQRVANTTISEHATTITDDVSGLPALLYLRRVD
ncbi:GNAT family N-acetyltransferase [Agrobacterium bohemicum]|uniref:N-acetyltransferase domain-containing protein n=1 Tax=Agrobacterium bohemicum TaxID=2052828 RepID=A0A135P829_9HYPH|nr:GNAT family N-acetyltransferase [Agrobacterium bohemicum]KXG87579.1 hypothetical protein ATO67_18185 [Agrobacterium bohemicum]